MSLQGVCPPYWLLDFSKRYDNTVRGTVSCLLSRTRRCRHASFMTDRFVGGFTTDWFTVEEEKMTRRTKPLLVSRVSGSPPTRQMVSLIKEPITTTKQSTAVPSRPGFAPDNNHALPASCILAAFLVGCVCGATLDVFSAGLLYITKGDDSRRHNQWRY